jgi:hypothetical protein
MARNLGDFSLRGDFVPDDISQQLGLNPTWTHQEGDIYPGSGRPRLDGEWCLACADDDFGDVADQIISLVAKLRPKAAIVAELATKFDGTMHLIAYLNGNYPGFFLSPSIVRDLASLNVDLDCKYICVSDKLTEDVTSAN